MSEPIDKDKRILELETALRSAINDGCHCDLMIGYICGIHQYERFLRKPQG